MNILITGGLGCIGAETAKWLLNNSDATVVVSSRDVSSRRVERVFFGTDCSRLKCVEADVRDQTRLEQILIEQQISRVVHLAALQTPDCNAHCDLGMQINLAGTQNLIEAMKSSGRKLDRYLFASSIAVYGPRAAYSAGTVPMLAEPQPVNVYGAWKLAGEHISKFFCDETRVATICLRPGVLYGPGRDAGLTASLTMAIKCVALGLPFEIPYRSRLDYQYVPDVGAAVGHALLAPFDGYGVFTLPSRTHDTHEMLELLRRAARVLGIEASFKITVGEEDVPFICELDYEPFSVAFPDVSCRATSQSLKESLEVFLEQAKRGWLSERDITC